MRTKIRKKETTRKPEKIEISMANIASFMENASDIDLEFAGKMLDNIAKNGTGVCPGKVKNTNMCSVCQRILPKIIDETNKLKVSHLCPCDVYDFGGILSDENKNLKQRINNRTGNVSKLLR